MSTQAGDRVKWNVSTPYGEPHRWKRGTIVGWINRTNNSVSAVIRGDNREYITVSINDLRYIGDEPSERT